MFTMSLELEHSPLLENVEIVRMQGCHYLLETWKNLETLENLENGHFGAKNLENGDFDQKINDKKPGKLHSGFYFSQM